MSVRKYIRQNIYKWHRVTSLIVAIPILLWTVSGFLHPVMNAKKPAVSNQALQPGIIDFNQIKIPLQEALLRNNIDSLRNFQVISCNGNHYYQVEQPGTPHLVYIDCATGAVLPSGDAMYATWLATRMVNEKPHAAEDDHPDHGSKATNDFQFASAVVTESNTTVQSVKWMPAFDNEYKASQKILPVYKVELDRPDHLRLYIDTKTGKLVSAIDDRKAWFDRFFAVTHSWSFLDGMGMMKHILLGCVSALCFFSSVFGFYVYNISKKAKLKRANGTIWMRRTHRVLGNLFLLTTTLYAVSGAWHTFKKIPSDRNKAIIASNATFGTNELEMDISRMQEVIKEKICGISVVRMQDGNYWQLSCTDKKQKRKKYINTATYTELPDGDRKYACWLACLFSGRQQSSISHCSPVTSFNHAYSMMNKRLPVMQVQFDESDNYFIETATGTLAARTGSADKAERFSFSNLHMHHYPEMWWGKEKGKPVRNIILMSTTAGLWLLAITGIIMYWMKRRKSFSQRAPRETFAIK